jgi:Spy/CpxP family protein refolding chaperone
MKKTVMVGLSAVLVVLALGTITRVAGQGEGRPHPMMAGPGHEAERLPAMLDSGTISWGAGIIRGAGPGEGRPHPMRAGPGREAERLLAMLDNDRVKGLLGLTDEQATRLRQIVVDTEKTAIKTKADLAVRGIELRELLRAANPDRDTVTKKVQEVSDLAGQLMQQRVQALLSVKTILTPAQQKKIREFSANHRMGRPGMQGPAGMFVPRPGLPGGQGRPPMPPRSFNEPLAHPSEPPVE